jgi:hypothetical protein
MTAVLLTGCADNEYSRRAIDGQYHGAMTYAAMKAINEATAPLTYQQSHADPEHRLPGRLPQHPKLEGRMDESARCCSARRRRTDGLTRMNTPTPDPSKRVGESADAASWDTAIEVGLVCDVIERIHEVDVRSDDGHAIDCIAVGHYLGVRPQDAELALDRSISEAVPRDHAAPPDEGGLITHTRTAGSSAANWRTVLPPRPTTTRRPGCGGAADPPGHRWDGLARDLDPPS